MKTGDACIYMLFFFGHQSATSEYRLWTDSPRLVCGSLAVRLVSVFYPLLVVAGVGGRGESSHNLTPIWSLDWVETDGQFSKKKTKSRAAWAMSISKKNLVHLFQINRLLVKVDFHHIISLVIWIQEPDLCRRSTRHALSTRTDWLTTVEMACSCVEFQQYHIPKVEW